MALVGVIASFATGQYTVTRTEAGTYTAGRYTPGPTSTFMIDASIQPASGRDLQVLAEGEHATEVRVVYTTTELRTRAPAHDPDRITIDGEQWEVSKFERWEAFGNTHWRGMAARRPVP
jgi:hypothetical protein